MLVITLRDGTGLIFLNHHFVSFGRKWPFLPESPKEALLKGLLRTRL